jgi:hypothetical protein
MWLLEQLRQGQEQEWSFLMCVDGLFLYFFWTYEGKRCLKKKCNVSNYTRQQQET